MIERDRHGSDKSVFSPADANAFIAAFKAKTGRR